ncbi:hypothetical protein DsansV1_C03g0034881 [Dioscorea sansibarensis]
MKLTLEDPGVVYQVVTVEKIWRCPGRVLNDSESARDVCLSFAMFKLLRRRFTSYPWAEANRPKTKKLILEGFLADHMRTLVIETELAFLYDSFYTKYPVVSHMPLTLLSSVGPLVGSCLVAVLLAGYKPPSEEEHLMRGKHYLCLLRLWAKVLLLFKYVQKASWQEMNLFQTLLSFVCQKRVLKPWDDTLGQYSLFDSYDYKPSLVKKLLMGVQRGQKASAPIQLPDEVKQAITQSLIDTRGKLRSIGEHSLTLCEGDGGDELSWACQFNQVLILHETLDLLRWHTCVSCKLNWLMEVGYAPETIVGKGVKLGGQLMELVVDDSLRFRLLREIWLEITLYIAPSHNTTAHARHLAKRGEFITHLWTLLCQLRIFERLTSAGEFIADDSE